MALNNKEKKSLYELMESAVKSFGTRDSGRISNDVFSIHLRKYPGLLLTISRYPSDELLFTTVARNLEELFLQATETISKD